MRKITRAMQMVSAAKMRKAQNAVLASRAYSALAWELISDLAGKTELEDPLLQEFSDAKKIGVILITSNMGLVGSLNSNLGPKIKEIDHQDILEAITYGKQAKNLSHRFKIHLLADFEKEDKTLSSEDIYPMAKFVMDAYVSGEFKSIYLVYNHFVSTLVQKPMVRKLLPFSPINTASPEPNHQGNTDYLFEPSPQAVVEHLLPRIVESQIYQTILESNASEHSARMVMMKNATEAAGDLIADLTLTYNQLRQNKITTELAEITAGKIALE